MRSPAWLVALSMVACGPTPPKSAVDEKIALSEQAPPAGYVQVRALSVQSGKGCGLLAERGSREDADRKLRLAAEKLGATYVHVTGRREPGPNHLCLDHEYQVSGVAYRLPAPAAPPSTSATQKLPSAPPATVPTLPHVLLDFENDAAMGKPSRATERSSLALSLAAGESSGTALSVSAKCSGGEPQALLDVWFELARLDFRSAKSITLRVKPDTALALSVSFVDGNQTGWTQHPAPLTPGAWQTVTLELYKFWHNPYGPPGDKPGAPVDLSAVSALAISPKDCADGHFLLDDVRLE